MKDHTGSGPGWLGQEWRWVGQPLAGSSSRGVSTMPSASGSQEPKGWSSPK